MKRGAPDILVDGFLRGLRVSDIDGDSREIFDLKTAGRPSDHVTGSVMPAFRRPAPPGGSGDVSFGQNYPQLIA
jgi:hypothetical protein